METARWLLTALAVAGALWGAVRQPVKTPEPVPAPPAVRLDAAALDGKVKELLKGHGDGIEASLWVGGPAGDPWYAWQAATPRPAASAIKTAYLVELFAAHAGKLDDPLPGADKLLADDAHPAWAPLANEQRAAARKALGKASVRRVGEVMMGKAGEPNAVYNAAANLATAALGGPESLTKMIHGRDTAFRGITARRYMLAARDAPGENEATAAALAAVLQRVSSGRVPGLDAETVGAVRKAVLVNESDPDGRHYFKAGSLDTDPLTEVRSGWFETDRGTVVYVVMAVQPKPGQRAREDASRRLRDTSFDLRDLLLAAARQALPAK